MKKSAIVFSAMMVLSPRLSSSFQHGRALPSVSARFEPSRALLQSRPRVTPLRYRDHGEETDGFVATAVSDDRSTTEASTPSTGVNLDSIRSIAMSQALALFCIAAATAVALGASGTSVDLSSLHWNGSDDFFSLLDFRITTLRFVEGVVAAFPIIFLGTHMESSDERDVCHVNFSTMNMVMMLFGRREHDHSESSAQSYPPETPMLDALALSTALAIVTGLSEEVVFRGILPSTIFFLTQSVPVTLVGQAALFGVGHVSPHASLGENKVISGLQASTGLWHGLVYLMAGGDILPCIIAHVLYDMHVFFETWMKINDQMDWTESAVRKRLPLEDEIEIRRIKEEAGPSLSTETLAHARRFFFAFDYDHRGSLSLSDVKRAVSYAFLQDKVQPGEERVVDLFERMLQQRIRDRRVTTRDVRDRLKLHEFLRLLFVLKAGSQNP